MPQGTRLPFAGGGGLDTLPAEISGGRKMAPAAFRAASRAVVLAAVLCIAGLVAPSPGNAASAGQRFRQVEIVDPSGFEQPMPAIRGLIPAGWQDQGGVVWNPKAPCGADGIQIAWSAWDPVSGARIETLPSISWQANDLAFQVPQSNTGRHCLNAPITTVRAYLEALAQIVRPGARVLDFRPQPDLVKLAGIQSTREALPSGEMRNWGEAGDLLIGYSIQGRDFREVIRGIATFFTSTMPGVVPGEIRRFLIGSAQPAFAMRAPDGSFDFRLFDAIQKSFRTDPQWSARVAKHNAEMTRINTKGAADRHAITMETHRYIADSNNKTWADRQASQERMQEKFSRVIRSVELYADPEAGQRVELPNTYNHAWRLQDGTYMMTDNPNFDPNVDLGMNGKRLQVTQ